MTGKAPIAFILLLALFTMTSGQSLFVENLDGQATEKEIQSFVNFIQRWSPPEIGLDRIANEYAQYHSGKNMKAMSQVYDISPRKEILDKMIDNCDVILASRNDILPAPKGHLADWTGRVGPAWPDRTKQSQTGGEQGDPIGHLGSCAKQILKNHKLYNQNVANGDRHGFGATYLQRAKRYVAEGDKSMDEHVFRYLLSLTDGERMYFVKGAPYKGGDPVPWNQVMMFTYGLGNLIQAHELLKDDKPRVAKYDKIVKANVDWFFNQGITKITDKKGKPAYKWGYTMPAKDAEDNNHGGLDVAGLVRLYESGRYHITAQQMEPIVNTLLHIMRQGDSQYAGRLNGSTGDGNSGATDYLRCEYVLAAQFANKDDYHTMLSDAKIPAAGKTTTASDAYSAFLWVKHRRATKH